MIPAPCLQGASEMVLEECTKMYTSNGDIVDLTQEAKEQLLNTVTEMANRGLRTLAITYADYASDTPPSDSPDENLVMMAVVGIKVRFVVHAVVLVHCCFAYAGHWLLV